MNENELRDRIGGAFGVEPPSRGFESRMRAALISPPPRRVAAVMWPLEVAGGLIAVVLVVALVLTHIPPPEPSVPTPLGVVPWADLPAPNVAQPFTKPGVPACRADQLSFELAGLYVGGGPKDTSFWRITVINTGASECFVGPGMDIEFSSAAGPLKMTRIPWGGDVIYLVRYDRAVGEVDLGPCFDPRVTRMTISPGLGLGSKTIDPGPAGGWGTPCPQSPETYFVELFPDRSQGGYAAHTQTRMEAPASAFAGERLRFFITITNQQMPHHEIAGTVDPTPSPVLWSPCPTYHVELEGVEGTFHTYQLNCAQAKAIEPNGSETFEMWIDVPASAKPGPATLVWSIDGPPQQWQRASAYVPIVS